MSVGDGLTMEVISLISASIVDRHIINVHLWREGERETGTKKKTKLWPLPHSFCSAVIFSLLGFYALLRLLCLHAASPSPCCAAAVRNNMHVEKDGKTLCSSALEGS